MSQIRQIQRIVTGSPQVDGAGVKLVRVLGHGDVQDFDPFLMLDAFDSHHPADYTRGFPWHPHRGIETVTYLIQGDIEHGDSLGNHGHILSGGCQWMTAGSGIIHQEMPQASERMLGLQLWLNLPRKYKLTPPKYRDLSAASIPKVKETTGTVGVISGVYGETPGATRGEHVEALMLDVALEPNASWRLPVESQSTVFIYIVEGAASCDASAFQEAHRAILFSEGDEIAIHSGPAGVRFLLFSAKPLREPIAWGGPIVMNTREELQQAFAELDSDSFIRERISL